MRLLFGIVIEIERLYVSQEQPASHIHHITVIAILFFSSVKSTYHE